MKEEIIELRTRLEEIISLDPGPARTELVLSLAQSELLPVLSYCISRQQQLGLLSNHHP